MHDEILSVEEVARELAHRFVNCLTVEELNKKFSPAKLYETHYMPEEKDLMNITVRPVFLPLPPQEPLPETPNETESARRTVLWAMCAKGFEARILECLTDGSLNARSRADGGYEPERPIIGRDSLVSTDEAMEALKRSGIAFNEPCAIEQPAQEPEQEQPTTAATVEEQPKQRDNSPPNTAEESWQGRVRCIADELHSRDQNAGAYSSIEDISHRVAEIAAQRSIEGPRGKLTAANIKREALQGGRWKRKATAERPYGESGEPGEHD